MKKIYLYILLALLLASIVAFGFYVQKRTVINQSKNTVKKVLELRSRESAKEDLKQYLKSDLLDKLDLTRKSEQTPSYALKTDNVGDVELFFSANSSPVAVFKVEVGNHFPSYKILVTDIIEVDPTLSVSIENLFPPKQAKDVSLKEEFNLSGLKIMVENLSFSSEKIDEEEILKHVKFNVRVVNAKEGGLKPVDKIAFSLAKKNHDIMMGFTNYDIDLAKGDKFEVELEALDDSHVDSIVLMSSGSDFYYVNTGGE